MKQAEGSEMTLNEFISQLDGRAFKRMIIGEAEIYEIVEA